MLRADKQVLDSELRNGLQRLRVLELNNINVRFDAALTPAALIAGFCFENIAAMRMIDHEDARLAQVNGERVFYVAASTTLALALFCVVTASGGIIFTQRLKVQATAEQGSIHDRLIGELNHRFVQVAGTLAAAMVGVNCAAVSVVWMKQTAWRDSETHHAASITATVVAAVVLLYTAIAVSQMYVRLHTWSPASSTLALTAAQRMAGAKTNGMTADEFFLSASSDEAVRGAGTAQAPRRG